MEFTHFNQDGRARMVNVSQKEESRRSALACGTVFMNRETLELIRSGGISKGDVLAVAQVAGIMGAKKTPDLIPMCHVLNLSGIDIRFEFCDETPGVRVFASAVCVGRTGVEMEVLTAVSTACLTIYDMCKAVQRDMVISDIKLLEKDGGTHGDYRRE